MDARLIKAINKRDDAPWTQDDVETLITLANQAAIAVDQRFRVHDSMSGRVQRLPAQQRPPNVSVRDCSQEPAVFIDDESELQLSLIDRRYNVSKGRSPSYVQLPRIGRQHRVVASSRRTNRGSM